MKAIAINGSPRKNWNTAQLLESALKGAASAGAETELIHLYDLDYKGCVSCFGCKRQGAELCKCYLQDALSPVLERVLSADALFLGSPIYFGDVTGQIRSFTERLLFICLSYDKFASVFPGSINTAYFFTMNVGGGREVMYQPLWENYANALGLLGGSTEYYAAIDTLQFDDYSKYHAAAIDGAAKRARHETEFPRDLQAAFDIGKRLIEAKK